MMIHDFDLARFYLDDNDDFDAVFATGSNMQNRTFDRLKDFELATCVLKSKKGVQRIITNLDIVALATIKELSCLVIKEC